MAGSSEIESNEKQGIKSGTLEDVVYLSWDTELTIDMNNNGHFIHTVRGRVRRGRLRDVSLSILSDAECDFEEIELTIRDLDTGEEIIPEPVLTEKRFKRVKIPFKYPVDTDEEFGYEAKYTVPKSFKAVGEDYYSHRSLFNKMISIIVNFPDNVSIQSIADSRIKTAGGIEIEIPKTNMPQVSKNRKRVKWEIINAFPGNVYALRWRTVRVGEKEN